MTAPGLAMFYGGLVRKKNVLSVMMQCMFLMGLMTVIWALWGYSLAFGGDGNVDWQRRVPGDEQCCSQSGTMRLRRRRRRCSWRVSQHEIPLLTHMLFQGMFFIITPALICGAFAERMKFSTMVVFHGAVGDAGLLPALPLGVGRRDSGVCDHCRWCGG